MDREMERRKALMWAMTLVEARIKECEKYRQQFEMEHGYEPRGLIISNMNEDDFRKLHRTFDGMLNQ